MIYVLLAILTLAILSPIIIGFLVVKLTERERPKRIGQAIDHKPPAGAIEQQTNSEQLTSSASNYMPESVTSK